MANKEFEVAAKMLQEAPPTFTTVIMQAMQARLAECEDKNKKLLAHWAYLSHRVENFATLFQELTDKTDQLLRENDRYQKVLEELKELEVERNRWKLSATLRKEQLIMGDSSKEAMKLTKDLEMAKLRENLIRKDRDNWQQRSEDLQLELTRMTTKLDEEAAQARSWERNSHAHKNTIARQSGRIQYLETELAFWRDKA